MTTLEREIESCSRCTRLRQHCIKIAETKKPEFKTDAYWGKPVPGFGDINGTVWIIGLAPAAHGANRTGRMFTGDSSGKWLYRALYQTGFSNKAESVDRKDDLTLREVYISAAARCAPPDNKPTKKELENCFPYLIEEQRLLKNVTLILALGAIAFDASLRVLTERGEILPSPKPKFRHGAFYSFKKILLLASYHPSRQNTQTGRLTESMWIEIFEKLKDHAFSKG